jgi:Na+-transporting NADH:ubiquinone oxidoreductase subunit NqrB
LYFQIGYKENMGEFLEWLSVVGLSTVKVLAGLAMAITHGMKPWEIFAALAAGSMIGVTFFTFFGLTIRRWRKERRMRLGIVKPLNYRKARKWKRMWLRFGLPGIALLTPPLISPPIGALIAVIFERRKGRILAYMGVSILLWSALFALVGDQILALIHR